MPGDTFSEEQPRDATWPETLDGLLMEVEVLYVETEKVLERVGKISWVRVQIRNGARARWANVSTAMACRCCLGAKRANMQSELVMESSKENTTAAISRGRKKASSAWRRALESSEKKRQQLVARCERETGFAGT
jgi:hypothetical protein